VEGIRDEFVREKLVFLWNATDGKQWGFFVGIDKPGRLPSLSERLLKRYQLGAEPPWEELEQFIGKKIEQPKPRTNKKRQIMAHSDISQIDLRHAPTRALIQELHQTKFKVAAQWDASEAKAFSNLLKTNPSWKTEELACMVRNYFASEGVNGDRPRKWLPNLGKYSAGPLDRFQKAKSIQSLPQMRNPADVVKEQLAEQSQ